MNPSCTRRHCNKHYTWNVPLHCGSFDDQVNTLRVKALPHVTAKMACLLCGPLAFLAFMQVTHKRFLDSVGRMPKHITTRVAHRHEGSHEQTLCHSHTISIMELLTRTCTSMTRFLSSSDGLLAQSICSGDEVFATKVEAHSSLNFQSGGFDDAVNLSYNYK